MGLFLGKKQCPRCYCIRNKRDFRWGKNVYELCNSCRYDEIREKQKEKETQQKKAPKPIEYEDKTFPKQVTSHISGIKQETYVTPGVDEVIITERHAKEQLLTRPMDYRCPKCKSILYNTKLDGRHYYCPTCNVQWDRDDLHIKFFE